MKMLLIGAECHHQSINANGQLINPHHIFIVGYLCLNAPLGVQLSIEVPTITSPHYFINLNQPSLEISLTSFGGHVIFLKLT